MIFLYKTLIFLFFLFSSAYPQFYADSVVSDYVIEFMEIADEFAKQIDPERKVYKKIFSDEEIKHIAELYFKCYNDNPLGFNQYVNEKHNEWAKAPYEIGMKSMHIRMRPWLKVYALRDQVAKKYGIAFTEVIGTPAILRGKFITSTRSSYYSPDIKSNFQQMNFNFLIEDILMGDKFFNVGDTVMISTIPNIESPAPKFETDKSYLIPVRPWIGLNEYNGEVSFNYLHEYYDRWIMGKPPKTFPVIDEKITNCEYFAIGDTSWTDFKKYFKETFLIFN